MVDAIQTQQSISVDFSSRSIFTCAVLAVVWICAKDTAIPAFGLPSHPTTLTEPVQPAEILAATPQAEPVLPAKVSLTRIKTGFASWYGEVLQGHRTASGRRFNMYEFTAAHRDLPFGSKVKVTNLRTRRTVTVTITDRGVIDAGRVIDLSYAAAKQLQMIKSGVDPVALEVLTAKNVPRRSVSLPNARSPVMR